MTMDASALHSLWLSIEVAAVATAGVVAVGVPAAYMLARGEFRGRELIDMALTLPLVLPPTVTGYYLVVLFGRNGLIGGPIYRLTGFTLMFTWYAAALASFVVAFPLMVKTSRAAIESVDATFVKASYTLGHGELRTAWRVVLPLARRGLISGAALSFARAIGEFGATLMLAGNIPGRTDTMPLAIYGLANEGQWPAAQEMVLMLTALGAVLLYIANRFAARSRS
jgi:molybdate transport system permease protein